MRTLPIIFFTALFGCAGQAEVLDAKDDRDERLANLDQGNPWAFVQIPNDRDFSGVDPIVETHMTADEKVKPESPDQNLERKLPKKVAIRKCKKDAGCTAPKVCLFPTGGPHPYGICGQAIDRGGRPTPNRRIRACGPHVPCPSGTCVLAYGDWGVCYK